MARRGISLPIPTLTWQGASPCCVFWWGGKLPHCVSFTHRCNKGGKTPLLSCILHTQMQWEGKPSSIVFPLQTDATRGGKPSPIVFLFHTDTMRGENPLLSYFLHTQMQWEGETLSHCVFFTHRHDKRGKTLFYCVSTQMWWEEIFPLSSYFLNCSL